ncbi:hypothetical protein M5689_012103 [Euphorbia peplus]|nr:hypothetical protein M5689_012103 [Euphorbia peplus]
MTCRPACLPRLLCRLLVGKAFLATLYSFLLMLGLLAMHALSFDDELMNSVVNGAMCSKCFHTHQPSGWGLLALYIVAG